MTTCIHCHIKILSPVHLGCDEVYDPLSFSVDTANNRLVVFDTAEFLFQLDRDKLANFSAICRKGTLASILEIYKFFARERPKGRDLAVTNGFVRHYEKTLNLPLHDTRKLQQELNRFTIYRTAFLPVTDRAYIPGSAVKGSLRTAYLNLLARTMKQEHLPKGNAKELEKTLLGGSFQSDPLRLVKVSDFMPVGAPKTKILYAVNEKKRISEFQARGPHQILEVIEPGAVFQGTITIEPPPPQSQINKSVEFDTLWKSLQDFFGSELEREKQEYARINRKHSLPSVAPEARLLRIGRHSGAECVTIAAVRSILIRGTSGETRKEKGATTLWMAADAQTAKQSNNLMPFGWASLHLTDEEQRKAFDEQESSWRQTLVISEPVIEEKKEPTPAAPRPTEPAEEEWEQAHVVWNPGKGEITVRHGANTAVARDINLVDERLRDRLKKKKRLTALVRVSHEGGTYYRILSVELR